MNICLIVEDSIVVVEVWKEALKPLQLEIWHCDNLVEAKLLCQKIPPPDLMLLDLRLIDAHDIDTVRAIKDFKIFNPKLIILVLSGYLNPDLIELALKQGATDIEEKSKVMRRQDLWTSIQKALAKAPQDSRQRMKFTADLIEKLSSI